MKHLRTQVCIVGAGPAGLLLSHLLHLEGVESTIVENRSREYVEHRVRAGVLEQGTVDLLEASGVGARLKREGLVHRGIELRFDGHGHRIAMTDLTGGRAITVYGQQEVVKDLIRQRLADGGDIRFSVSDVRLHDIETSTPGVSVRDRGQAIRFDCDIVAGCDGFHGVCRAAIPNGALHSFERAYPFAWLGILAEAPPTHDELIYAYHDRGFALFTMRSPTLSRLYLQCAPDEDIDNWPDARIWDELETRLGGVRPLQRGKILQKGITPMRSYVAEPMQSGRLFLAGDAAHIVPPTGAKGMNLAMADVRVLSRAIAAHYKSGREDLLQKYSATCLSRVWKGQRFSWWMTQMLHRHSDEMDFDTKRQIAEIDYVTGSQAAMTSLAENYAGLPMS